MEDERERENREAMDAAGDPDKKEQFLQKEQQHILRLTRRILGKNVSMSDDEWSIALMAVNEALGRYSLEKGNFWNYAAVVIQSRTYDYYRSASKTSGELLVRPDAFSGSSDEESEDQGLAQEIAQKTAVVVDRGLADEIEALSEELGGFEIDFFSLAEYAPKSEKTKKSCRDVLKAFFQPPPLTEELKRTGNFPVKQLLSRLWVSRKLLDRHRKYLIAAAVILAGDYPGLSEYLPYTGRN